MFSRRSAKKRSFKRRTPYKSKRRTLASIAKSSNADATNPRPVLFKMAKPLCSYDNIYSFMRECKTCAVQNGAGTLTTVSAIGSITTGWQEHNFYFILSAIPNYTQFSTLFDQFRIIRVELRLIPRINFTPTNSLSSQVGSTGTVLWSIDYDNSSSLSGNDDTLRSQMAYEQTAHKELRVSVAPCRKFSSIDNAGSSQSSSGITREWCDMAYPTIPWFGVRTMISPTVATNDIYFDTRVRYYFQCRNTI